MNNWLKLSENLTLFLKLYDTNLNQISKFSSFFAQQIQISHNFPKLKLEQPPIPT